MEGARLVTLPSRLVSSSLAAAVVVAACSIQDVEPPETTTRPPPAEALTLGPDGLGPVSLGTDPDTVVEILTPLVGGPGVDTGWTAGGPGIYGDCPGPLRVMAFGSLVTFSTGGPTDGRFFAYSYGFSYEESAAGVDPRGLDLATAEGVGIGSTVADLEATGAAVDGTESIGVWTFAIHADGDPHLRGQVTGPDPEDTVLFIETSTGCS